MNIDLHEEKLPHLSSVIVNIITSVSRRPGREYAPLHLPMESQARNFPRKKGLQFATGDVSNAL